MGYATSSEYEKLTRMQQGKATRFTHDFREVAVITQPKGTGSLQRPPCTDQTGEQIRQVGSADHSTLRRATDGSAGVEMVTRPFNRTALHARSAAQSKKARAENAERELETPNEWRKRQYTCSVDLEVQQETSERENMQQGLARGTAVWAMSRRGQGSDKAFNGSQAQQALQADGNVDATDAAHAAESNPEVRGRLLRTALECERHDLALWFYGWHHWHMNGDRELRSCIDFDAMYFAKTQRVRLGGAWGCVLAWTRETWTTPQDA